MVFFSILPPLGLIFAVLGSLFAGMATPTEAAAVGAIGAAVIAALYREAQLDGDQGILLFDHQGNGAMVFWIILGASMFTSVSWGSEGERRSGVHARIGPEPLPDPGDHADRSCSFWGALSTAMESCSCASHFGPIVKELGLIRLVRALITIMIESSYLSPPFANAIFPEIGGSAGSEDHRPVAGGAAVHSFGRVPG